LFAGATFIRREPAEEDFHGTELGDDMTTYVPYEMLVEAKKVLEALIDGKHGVDKQTPLVVYVCTNALDDARKVLDIPHSDEGFDFREHSDWISMAKYCKMVRSLALAMLEGNSINISRKGHNVSVTSGKNKEWPVIATAPVVEKAIIKQMTVAGKEDLRTVLESLRSSDSMIIIDIKADEDTTKVFLRAIQRTAKAHNGDVVMIDNKLVATSRISINTQHYRR
jgi:SepF-like predicted cell division protein (DUF552 family)